jgi:hypothetical protein
VLKNGIEILQASRKFQQWRLSPRDLLGMYLMAEKHFTAAE